MLRIIDQLDFVAGVASPQNKDDRTLSLIQLSDDGVSKDLPALIGMGISLMCSDGQRSIQEQDAFFSPLAQTAMTCRTNAQISLQLFIEIE